MDKTIPRTVTLQPESHEEINIVGADGAELGFAYLLRGACGPFSVLKRDGDRFTIFAIEHALPDSVLAVLYDARRFVSDAVPTIQRADLLRRIDRLTEPHRGGTPK